MRAALLIAALSLCTAPALADVAPPSPGDLNCPRGSAGRVQMPDEGRGFTTSCEPTTCAADDDCDGGDVCSTDEIGLCVEQVASARGEPVPSARQRGCEPSNTCLNVSSTCERSRRCVSPEERSAAEPVAPAVEEPVDEPTEEPADEPSEEPAAQTGSGCGCRAAPAGPGPAWLLALAGLALLRRR